MGIFDKLLRRTSERARVRRPRVGVRVSMEESAEMHRLKDGTAQFVILENLSYGGAKIATTSKLGKGEQLTLIINAGKRQPFEVGCAVVTTLHKAGRIHRQYGVKFVAIKPGEIERLRRFVSERDDSRKSGNAFI